MPDPTLGQVAYEKHGQLLRRTGKPPLPWESLRPPVRTRWEALAAAVLEAREGSDA